MDGLGAITAAILALALIFALTVGVLHIINNQLGAYPHQELLEACEKELPRNKHCILQAAPATEDETR